MLDVEQRAESVDLFRPVEGRISVRRIRRFIPVILGLQDALLIYVALCAAFWVRYSLHVGPKISGGSSFLEYQDLGFLLLGIMLPTLFAKGAYHKRLSTEIIHEITAVFGAATIAVASIIVITFMLHRYEYSRGVIVYLWGFLIVFLVMGRVFNRCMQTFCHRRGWGIRKLLIVGASDVGKMIMQSVMNRPDLGYAVVGFVDRRSAPRVTDFGRFRKLGVLTDIQELIDAGQIDDVVIALPGSAHEDVTSIVSLCERSNVGIKLVPDLFRMSLSKVRVDDIGGIPLLDVQERTLRPVERVLKRGLDLLVGSLVLALSLPVLGILALLIWLDSPGPIFIKQERLGRDGRRFFCYKLRTMHAGAEKLLGALLDRNEVRGPIFKMRNDPRCTRVGRQMRRLSLDELPQIWNVVRGDMSLVGPRPPLPSEVQEYEDWHRRRLETTPGMTGLWQVSGRSTLSFDEMVMMDITYVDNWSLALDLKILMRTLTAVLAGRGAY